MQNDSLFFSVCEKIESLSSAILIMINFLQAKKWRNAY